MAGEQLVVPWIVVVKVVVVSQPNGRRLPAGWCRRGQDTRRCCCSCVLHVAGPVLECGQQWCQSRPRQYKFGLEQSSFRGGVCSNESAVVPTLH